MATEPERPIEKLLRASATRRRDEAGAPIELHPATRRWLHGEVARKFPRGSAATAPLDPPLLRLWPRFAWGFGIFAVLGVVVWFLVLPTGDESTRTLSLAKNEPAPEAAPEREFASPPAAAPVTTPAGTANRTDQPMRQSSDAALIGNDKDTLRLRSQNTELAGTQASASDEAAAKRKIAPAPLTLGEELKKTEPASTASASGAFQRREAPAESDGSGRRYGLAGGANAPAAAPAPATPPPSSSVVSMTPAANSVATDELRGISGEKSAGTTFDYKAPEVAATASMPPPSAEAKKDSFASTLDTAQKIQPLAAVQRYRMIEPTKEMEGALQDRISPAQPVLASFQVEQSGRDLRIVDADGSVYQGYVQLAADAQSRSAGGGGAKQAAPSKALRAARSPAAQAGVAGPARDAEVQNYFFQVTGTNRSLKKKVVFSGTLATASNSMAFKQLTNSAASVSAFGGARPTGTPLAPVQLLNSRITGKASVGGAREIEINAVPTAP